MDNTQNKEQLPTVMILCAGLGTRLRPLTDTIPKPMIPIAPGLPFLEYLLVQLKDQGFTRFVVNLHYLPEKITDYFGDGSKWGIHIDYSFEPTLLDTAGAVKKAEKFLTEEFMVVYGDGMQNIDFRPFVEFHREKNAFATLMLKHSGTPPLHADIAEIDMTTKKIVRWHVRPHAIEELSPQYFLSAGVYMLSKKILEGIPEETPFRFETQIFPDLITHNAEVYGYPLDTELLDIGTPEQYEAAKEWYIRHVKS